jgi:hypothetical protein
MITDSSYFILDCNLPVAQIPEISYYITKFEPEILKKCLGESLYNEFISGLSSQSIAQKWLDLRDGKTYVNNGLTIVWPGFKNAQKESLLTYFIYYKFLYFNGNFATTSGMRVANSENSRVTDSRNEQVFAYNKCLDLIGCEEENIKQNYQIIKLLINNKSTLYNFLKWSNEQNSSTYPNWEFTKLEKINIFNI